MGEVNDSLWEQIGGTPVFEAIVETFYEGVKGDDVLAPMYPQDDWEGAKWRLRTFLEQYWGGPSTYSDNRGHPRLRMRHAAYPVNALARERWLLHMNNALDLAQLAPMADAAFREYIERAALSLTNTPG